MRQQPLDSSQSRLYTAHSGAIHHGATNNKNHDWNTHSRNNGHHLHERIPHTPTTYLQGSLYRRTPHLICQLGSRSLGVLYAPVKDRMYGKNDSKLNHTPGKPKTMATNHHQQMSYLTTSRVRPRCRTKTESKRREGQKSCKEDGDSDIVGEVMRTRRRGGRRRRKEQRPISKRSSIDLALARNRRSPLGLIILSLGQLMICFNRYPQSNSMERLGALMWCSKALLGTIDEDLCKEIQHLYSRATKTRQCTYMLEPIS